MRGLRRGQPSVWIWINSPRVAKHDWTSSGPFPWLILSLTQIPLLIRKGPTFLFASPLSISLSFVRIYLLSMSLPTIQPFH